MKASVLASLAAVALLTSSLSAKGASLWSTSTTPANLAASDTSAVTLGVRFKSSAAGTISGIRFYKSTGNTGTHVGALYSNSGVLLAQATFSGETASGWQQVNFSTPVNITANTVYVAAYHTNVGRYSYNLNYFSSAPYVNGQLTAPQNTGGATNGCFGYGASIAFPSSSYLSANYWVDVVFNPGGLILNVVNNPHLGGYPDATNTGVPAGTSLTASGNISVSTNGTVIDAKNVTGDISVQANNVTIKRCRVVNAGGLFCVKVAAGCTNVTIEDCELRGTNTTSGRVQYCVLDQTQFGQNVKVYRCNMYYSADSVQGVSALLQDSYIHDFGFIAGDHSDGFQTNGGGGATIRHNTILLGFPQTGCVALFQDFSAQANNTIENNLLAGGGYCIYGGAGSYGASSNIKIINNRFSKKFYSTGGANGVVTYYEPAGSGNEWSGNYWDEDGAAVGY